ncbi:MAG TPA: hypothetical protein PK078_13415 [Anaerolineales bacterium]|nr:hypothetical protein [Anaerolineales bacterium]HNA89327.1 hypothetical protein [Anaerolineales bacterium]HNC10060.1 hypothetical protein [Anaerolineales bacterium]
MKQNKRASMYLLILGMVFLVIGISTDNTIFTWISIAFVVISLILGGRWLRPRKR